MNSISVFEIIKVGIGPSSSHTMGPWNGAEMFLNLIRRDKNLEEVQEVFVEFFGSLAKTGIGHGTDIAGMLGLSGENFREIDTNSINSKIETIKTQQEIVEKLDAFENLIQSLEQEIKLRKQQYEYYREKLLTFEKQ